MNTNENSPNRAPIGASVSVHNSETGETTVVNLPAPVVSMLADGHHPVLVLMSWAENEPESLYEIAPDVLAAAMREVQVATLQQRNAGNGNPGLN